MKLFALVCVWPVPCVFLFAPPLQAGPAGQTQYLSNFAAVPQGLSATDWQSIRALYQANRQPAALVTLDPLAQQAYLKASNTDAGDQFGYSVAISGDTVVIGAKTEDSVSTGVNGDQSDNGASDSGAAYVFVRTSGVWSQQAYLKASNTDAGDQFGLSVAISGDTIVVGANLEDSFSTGVNGNQADNSGLNSGAAYVFVRSGGVWTQQAYLKASNTDSLDLFGYSVAISGDTIVVGAFAEDSSATGVDGDQFDNNATDSGAAYVFFRSSGGIWSQQAYLKASNTDVGDEFGFSVAISADRVAIGAREESSNGNEPDNSAVFSGAAYVFVRANGVWTQEAYLKASNIDVGDEFGFSVAISGNLIVVGAPFESSGATGVSGDQADNSAPFAGAAYVFGRRDFINFSVWTQEAYLKASNTDAGDDFGYSVAISGDTIIVGAYQEDSNATGVDGNQLDNGVPSAGAAYLFTRTDSLWTQQAYLKASNTDAGDFFGFPVGVSGETIVVGGSEDSAATGVDGDQMDNSAPGAGAAYVFTALPTPTPTPTTLGNISTRLQVETDDKVLIGGVIVTGTQPKKVLLRAIGPSLPLSGALADPFLELHDGSGAVIASNDNWKDAPNKQEIIDSTIAPANDLESAILATLDPGLYTAILRGVNNTTGVGLVEAYDLDRSVDSQLANISTRGFVQTGDDVMIGGFILLGDSAQKVIVRALGPSLPVDGKVGRPGFGTAQSRRLHSGQQRQLAQHPGNRNHGDWPCAERQPRVGHCRDPPTRGLHRHRPWPEQHQRRRPGRSLSTGELNAASSSLCSPPAAEPSGKIRITNEIIRSNLRLAGAMLVPLCPAAPGWSGRTDPIPE